MANEGDPNHSSAPGTDLKAVFRVLQSSHAIELLSCLLDGPADVRTLADRLEIDQSAVSKALSKLYLIDLVSMKLEGRHHIYRVSDSVKYAVSGSEININVGYPDGTNFSYSIPRMSDSHEYDVRIARVDLNSGRPILPDKPD